MIQKKRANLKDQSSLALEQKYVQDARKSSLTWIINAHEMEENILLLFTFPYFVDTDEKVKYITFPNTSPNTFDKQMFEEQVFNNFIIEGGLQIYPENISTEINLKDVLSTLGINHEI